MYSPASTKSSRVSKPTCGWGSPSKEGERAWIVGAGGTKEITARANSNRMTAPTSVVTDCFACIFFVTTSLLQECLSVSVQPSRYVLDSLPRETPSTDRTSSWHEVSLDLFLEWFFAPVCIPPLWADAPGNRRGKLERAEEFLAMPHIMIR